MITGLVLAAGGSRRLGEAKQLLPFRGRTLLGATLDMARACGFDELVVTLGGSAAAIRATVDLSGVRVIEIDFREEGPNGLRFNTFAAKRARGMMARYLCEHRLSDPEALQRFDSDGYRFDPENSDEGRWRFRRS